MCAVQQPVQCAILSHDLTPAFLWIYWRNAQILVSCPAALSPVLCLHYCTLLYSGKLCCTVYNVSVPYCAVQCTTVLYSVQLYWTVPYSAVLWKLYYTVLYSTVKYRAEPRKLYSRILCCTVESLLYKTVLHSCPVALWPIMLICLTIITVDHREPAWHS